ncbi:MAG: hypothetical protein IH604_13535 [Burkholderiales bacterium]|nr:hypothetical protein [Burkholderiales bacterium]
MAEPDDLLGKADALMARNRPGRPPGTPYAEIPILDEVVAFHPGTDDLPVLTEYVVTEPPGEEQIAALAENIRTSLLADMQPRIDALIEQRLSDELATRVERVFDALRGDLQLLAREIVDEAIHDAVEQERNRRK